MVNRLVGVAVAAATLVGCGGSDATPSDAEVMAYAESAPPLGEAVEYFVYTHCGVDSLRIDGRWWHAEETLYGDGGPGTADLGRRRGGWDEYQAGRLTLESEDSAVFEAEGTVVEFVPAPDDRPVAMCR